MRKNCGPKISPIAICVVNVDIGERGVISLTISSSLFVPDQIQRTERSVGYIGQFDCDALTQHQAGEVLQDLETFKLYIVHSSIT